uniref:serine C-palmitoyltransferase n=1 Tax=Cacopsylla melanoneura TaxID=428564 RepID=A0A8D8T8X2_9HEMI
MSNLLLFQRRGRENVSDAAQQDHTSNGTISNGISRKPNSVHHSIHGKHSSSNGTSHLSNGTHSTLSSSNGEAQPQYRRKWVENFESVPFMTAILTYFGFYLLMIMGYINYLLFVPNVAKEKNRDGYPALYDKFVLFYSRYVYRRIVDCFNRPITSVPGALVTIKDRETPDYGWTFKFTGTESTCINLGSYNYLGFGENKGLCIERSIESVRENGCALCSTTKELGSHSVHDEVEALTAQFLGVESAMVVSMGFACNALNLPSIVSEGCLVLSDEKNHASIITGLKVSRATVRLYQHNNPASLEKKLIEGIKHGQPHTGQPWRKILIVAEGIFSMDGSIVKLPDIVRLKNKYKAYLYLDEAHSIGALGPTGRGVTEYFDIDPREVDILMGTFTKSFGSGGGYIAGSKKTIDFIRAHSHVSSYASSMSPPVATQIITSMRIIMGLENGNEGVRRITVLAHNTRYFRRKLTRLGLIIYGHRDSPVVPMLVFFFSKVGGVVRELKARGIAAVGVGFPATPLMKARIRFCISASHTKEQLDEAVEKIAEVADKLGLRYSRRKFPPNLKPVVWGESDDDDY